MLSYLYIPFRSVTFFSICYLLYNYNPINLLNILFLVVLFVFDIFTIQYPLKCFQFFFILLFIISIVNIIEYYKSFYSFLFLFYSLFQSIYFIYYYNCIFLYKKYNNQFLEYLENFDDVIIEEEECYICLENYKEKNGLKYLNCSHVFHPSCLLQWYNSQKYNNFISYNCPVCKNSIFMEKGISV